MIHYYSAMLILSTLCLLIYMAKWHTNFDTRVTVYMMLIPIVNVGYYLLAKAETVEAASLANKITYLGGTAVLFMLMMFVFAMCRPRIQKGFLVPVAFLEIAIYSLVLTSDSNDYFYKSIEIRHDHNVAYLIKEYAFGHTLFYVSVFVVLAATIYVLVISYRKCRTSLRITNLLMGVIIVSMIGFFGGRAITRSIELMPLAFDISMILIICIIDILSLYDVEKMIADNIVRDGELGCFSFDLKRKYLGGNEIAKECFPFLAILRIDGTLTRGSEDANMIQGWIDEISSRNSSHTFTYKKNGRIYSIEGRLLTVDGKTKGYHFLIKDNTLEEEYKELLATYSTQLEKDIHAKTDRLLAMHDKLIRSMADLVESRDTNTGGHVKRTSRCVEILTSEMQKDPSDYLTDDFCRCVAKAAPMHDLGKIAVDDAILRKPGKYTPEEFSIMKTHAAKGADIVQTVLADQDDVYFTKIAENVAHYHHERWDGSGYPEGLKGTDIPLEARIMAIADVYDALVSKRCYKESMSFEEAYNIIIDGMGKHFDSSLEKYFIAARPSLESYYTELSRDVSA